MYTAKAMVPAAHPASLALQPAREERLAAERAQDPARRDRREVHALRQRRSQAQARRTHQAEEQRDLRSSRSPRKTRSKTTRTWLSRTRRQTPPRRTSDRTWTTSTPSRRRSTSSKRSSRSPSLNYALPVPVVRLFLHEARRLLVLEARVARPQLAELFVHGLLHQLHLLVVQFVQVECAVVEVEV